MSLPQPPPGKHLDRERYPAAAEWYRRLAAGEPATTRCPRCGVDDFPPRLRCTRCNGSTEWIALPLRGSLYAFTTQERGLRFTAPAVLALAQFGPAVLPGVMDGPIEALGIGLAVELVAAPIEELGISVCRFVPVEAAR